jgi:hypothetical protein
MMINDARARWIQTTVAQSTVVGSGSDVSSPVVQARQLTQTNLQGTEGSTSADATRHLVGPVDPAAALLVKELPNLPGIRVEDVPTPQCDHIDIGGIDLADVQHATDRAKGKAVVLLGAAQPFLANGSDDPAIDDQCRRAIVAGMQSENYTAPGPRASQMPIAFSKMVANTR